MGVTEAEFEKAKARARAERDAGRVQATRFDRGRRRVVLRLSTGVELAFPAGLAEGLAGASLDELAEIEISPTRHGIHWPRLDADLYIPALLRGVLGSRSWMASCMGAAGGGSRSLAKKAAARENGRKGGRPRNTAND